MPRPGPRPYECARRAWHSDRHQPIRGSIIQHIFRVVTEAHSSTTRKNREWQQKLPRVVLKAEEIMYSKANSEAEYIDADTLWDRLNDAIDTIIRRDESTETGQCLQPCIEAALVLGCVPVRASRSQRHSNPRTYLNPRIQETPQVPPMIPDKINNQGPFSRPSAPTSNHLNTQRPGMANQTPPTTSYTATQTVHYYPQSVPRLMPSIGTESKPSLNLLGSVYPSYHSSQFPNVESQSRFHSAQNSYPDNIIIGRPVGWPRTHPTRFPGMGNPTIAADKSEQVRPFDDHGKSVDIDCDLSLRLGPGPSECCASVNNDGGGSSSIPLAKNVELLLFPRRVASDPSESCYERREQVELLDENTTLRNRRVEDFRELGNESGQWLPKFRHDQFDGQRR